MKINLITLASDLHKKNKDLIKECENFISEINNELLDDDYVLEVNDHVDGVLDAVLILSGGAEKEFLKIKDNLSSPFILFPIGKYNSLAASLEIKTYCLNNSINLCYSCGNTLSVAPAIKEIADLFYAKEKIKNTNLGVIGKPSDWLIASTVNKNDIYDRFNINLIDIKMSELYSFIDLNEIDTTHPKYQEILNKFKNKNDVDMAFAIYAGLKKIVDKYNLKGLTLRCFDLLKKYNNTGCLALALLNDEGVVSACEGDVPALLTMYLLYALTGHTSFMSNVSEINLQELTLILSHCTIPFSMVSKYNIDTHFESNCGVAINGELSLGKVTICKILPNSKDNLTCLSIPATIKENLSLKGFCRTQILVELTEPAMYEAIKDGYGNHVIVCYGDYSNAFEGLVNSMFSSSNK